MKYAVTLVAMALFSATVALAADPNNPEEYREIIEKRCTLCHTPERIEEAIRAGQDMNLILNKMMAMGATLSAQEQKVLGTFWGSPTK